MGESCRAMERLMLESSRRRLLKYEVLKISYRMLIAQLKYYDCSTLGCVTILQDRLIRARLLEKEPNNREIPWFEQDEAGSTFEAQYWVEDETEKVEKRKQATVRSEIFTGVVSYLSSASTSDRMGHDIRLPEVSACALATSTSSAATASTASVAVTTQAGHTTTVLVSALGYQPPPSAGGFVASSGPGVCRVSARIALPPAVSLDCDATQMVTGQVEPNAPAEVALLRSAPPITTRDFVEIRGVSMSPFSAARSEKSELSASDQGSNQKVTSDFEARCVVKKASKSGATSYNIQGEEHKDKVIVYDDFEGKNPRLGVRRGKFSKRAKRKFEEDKSEISIEKPRVKLKESSREDRNFEIKSKKCESKSYGSKRYRVVQSLLESESENDSICANVRKDAKKRRKVCNDVRVQKKNARQKIEAEKFSESEKIQSNRVYESSCEIVCGRKELSVKIVKPSRLKQPLACDVVKQGLSDAGISEQARSVGLPKNRVECCEDDTHSESSFASGSRDFMGLCYTCKAVGHRACECPEIRCFGCTKKGHCVRDCPERSLVPQEACQVCDTPNTAFWTCANCATFRSYLGNGQSVAQGNRSINREKFVKREEKLCI